MILYPQIIEITQMGPTILSKNLFQKTNNIVKSKQIAFENSYNDNQRKDPSKFKPIVT